MNHVADLPTVPAVPTRVVSQWWRHDVVQLLPPAPAIGIELGVAEGFFSSRMVSSGRFSTFFGVDVYGDAHNTEEYKRALRRVGLTSSFKLLRMRFDEALDLFPDEYFDFVYVDGYAHGGEEGGETIFSWFRKLKVGGVIAGDDYHPDWPLVVWAVNEFVHQVGGELVLTGQTEPDNPYCRYPTWAVTKGRDIRGIAPPQMLLKTGRDENARIARLRAR